MNEGAGAYQALALQLSCRAVNEATDRAEARTMMKSTIEGVARAIASSIAFIGRDCRLVVLPEYFLTGFPMGDPIESWSDKAALDMDGAEYEQLAGIARENGVFLAGNAYENDPNFPGLYFQTCFVIDPAGDVILRYRRINSLFAPTPHDLWDDYLDKYGLDGVFPVAITEIGKIAAVASDEILFPEIARCFAMRGAEVFVHPTSESAGPRSVKDAAKIMRAVENSAFVVSSNSGGIDGIDIPRSSTDGGSKVVDYRGLVLVEAGTGESMAAFAEIDLDAMRRFRRRPGMANLLSRQRFEAYSESYRATSFYPPNTMLGGVPERSHFLDTQRKVIERLAELGLI